ncbi:hypothetical protein J5N97_005136 [Dioscorea zingiberensis]|uniref:Uncharacterized protein n=1 Tax=Dioscorea zingiberensis TaxID=325984 RepID=A0A9D5D7I1_9LILI|nr:hypothetical protein J5N97_005136 [Dioscorea zingiberensis]
MSLHLWAVRLHSYRRCILSISEILPFNLFSQGKPEILPVRAERMSMIVVQLITSLLTSRQVVAQYSCQANVAYENAVGGKLRLKGKALNVKEGAVKKNKKKKHKHYFDQEIQSGGDGLQSGGILSDPSENKLEDEEHQHMYDDHLTPAERRYMEHWQS